ncbi:Tetratricopeptide repeat-containing protein [Halorubrum sodomense]|uniref:Tetratricopeptide repeat-containing protein n=1 Tax=Halorubrum sodomense TaxID=35743 RepID=A0A1I6H056_HALSD|nr:Tetratricopeptide repeat-containing protein [Halorubrum sodomense]
MIRSLFNTALESAIKNIEQILATHRRKATIPYTVVSDDESRTERLRLGLDDEIYEEWEHKRDDLLDAVLSEDTNDSSIWTQLGEVDAVLRNRRDSVEYIIDKQFATRIASNLGSKVARFGAELLRDFIIAYIAAIAVDSSQSETVSEDTDDLATCHVNAASNATEFAEHHFERALELNPENSRAHNNYGLYLKNELKQYEEAKHHHERAIELDSENPEAHNNYAILLKTEFDRDRMAAKHYKRAINIDPEFAPPHYNYGNLLKQRFGQYQKAKHHYERAIEIDPEYADAHHSYANLLRNRSSQYKNAKKHYERALKIEPEKAMVHRDYALLLKNKLNRYQKAKQHLKQAVEIAPENAFIHNSYADTLYNTFEEYRKAKRHFKRAVELDQKNPEYHKNYAICLRKLNYSIKARKHERISQRLS